jgi:hypothetical protein
MKRKKMTPEERQEYEADKARWAENYLPQVSRDGLAACGTSA